MRKLLILGLALMLIVGISTVALAEIDLGLSQNSNVVTFYRIDAGNFLFEVPVEKTGSEFSLGVTIPTEFWKSYGLAKINFYKDTNDNGVIDDDEEGFHYDSLSVGLGYPIEFGNFVLKGELEATNPDWAAFKETAISANLSLQFSWDALSPKTE